MYANKAIYLLKTSFAFENEAKKQKKKKKIPYCLNMNTTIGFPFIALLRRQRTEETNIKSFCYSCLKIIFE